MNAPRRAPGTQKKLIRVAQPKDFQRGASLGRRKTSQDEAKIPGWYKCQRELWGGSMS
jgi:hypothetical protein